MLLLSTTLQLLKFFIWNLILVYLLSITLQNNRMILNLIKYHIIGYWCWFVVHVCFCVDSSFPCFLIFKFFIIRRRNFKFLHCKSNRSGILSMVNEVFDAIFHLNLIFNSCLYFSSHSNFLILHIWQWFSFWKFKSCLKHVQQFLVPSLCKKIC